MNHQGDQWRQYQMRVADLFSVLGFEARLEQSVQGARAKHRIDVVVYGEVAGFPLTWVVECKLLHKPVDKAAVLTLKGVVDDVGADRGVLVSDSGFQPGAIASADSTNLILSDYESLSDLVSNALLARRFDALDGAINERTEQLKRLHPFTYYPQNYDPRLFYRDAINWLQWIYWRSSVLAAEHGMQAIRLGKWPVPVELKERQPTVDGSVEARFVSNLSEFVNGVEENLKRVDRWLDQCKPIVSRFEDEHL